VTSDPSIKTRTPELMLDVSFRDAVFAGLSASPKTLPCKFFYYAEGSRLFDRICELPEYYVTRVDLQLHRDNLEDIVAVLGENALIAEFGSGSSVKTRLLLDKHKSLAGYVPIDISEKHLLATAAALRRRYPMLPILPVVADYTEEVKLPEFPREPRRVVVYFPGSSIGNFTHEESAAFLERACRLAGGNGGLLIGIDMQKPLEVLLPAYNDAAGVTRDFNLNLLSRINRELDGDFNVSQFEHEATYNDREGRIEMRLHSRRDQNAKVAGREFKFAQGEAIVTEYSYKYTIEGFSKTAAQAGLRVARVWQDKNKWFSLVYLIVS
jgi:dimethylhistidine N-methyltransferase